MFWCATFLLVFLSGFVSLIGQIANINLFILPYLFPLVIFLKTLLLKNLKLSFGEIFLIILLISTVVLPLILGIGIGSGGTLIVVLLAIFINKQLSKRFSKQALNFQTLFAPLSQIYKIHLSFIALELLIISFGYQQWLGDRLGSVSNLQGYKTYNHAHFLNFIGLEGVGGLNSAFMGSQVASMLSVIAFTLLWGNKEQVRWPKTWLMFCSFFVALTVTMTSLAMLFSALALFYLVMPVWRQRNVKKVLFLIVSPFFASLIFYKIDNPAEFEVYYRAFIPGVEIFIHNLNELNWKSLLFGWGQVGHENNIQNSVVVGTDFGLMTLINQGGLLLFAICFGGICYINVKTIRLFRLIKGMGLSSDNDFTSLLSFAFGNLVVVNIFFVSLVHYTVAVEVGLRELFALHIGISLFVADYLQKKLRRTHS